MIKAVDNKSKPLKLPNPYKEEVAQLRGQLIELTQYLFCVVAQNCEGEAFVPKGALAAVNPKARITFKDEAGFDVVIRTETPD